MKLFLKSFIFILLAVSQSSCSNDYFSDNNVAFIATLNGGKEIPANNSTLTGSATLLFDPTTKIFTITVDHTVPVLTMGHIHKGAVGTNGPVVFGFPTPLRSLIVFTSTALTAEQEADLYAGLYYVNLHSAAFPGGEIRGNLIKK